MTKANDGQDIKQQGSDSTYIQTLMLLGQPSQGNIKFIEEVRECRGQVTRIFEQIQTNGMVELIEITYHIADIE